MTLSAVRILPIFYEREDDPRPDYFQSTHSSGENWSHLRCECFNSLAKFRPDACVHHAVLGPQLAPLTCSVNEKEAGSDNQGLYEYVVRSNISWHICIIYNPSFTGTAR